MATTALLVPVLDERPTVDVVVALVRDCLAAGVVDRAVVVDGGSTDGTPEAFAAAGVEVLQAAAVDPDRPVAGKGGSVWRAAQVVEADAYVLVDGDVEGLGVDQVRDLRAALEGDGVHLAKGSFDRLQRDDGSVRELGGRVTELLARPLLARFAPDLDHVRQPLSGQQAVWRATLRGVPLLTGYGLELGLLLAVRQRHGAAAVVDVPLPPITHDSKADASLVPMAHQVLTAAAWGLGLEPGSTPLDPDADPGGGLEVRPATLTTTNHDH